MNATVEKYRLHFAVLVISVFSLNPLAAHADSYQVIVVNHTQHEDFYGIDDKDDFVVDLFADISIDPSHNPCGIGSSSCYATYYGSLQSPVYSISAPALNYDNGVTCSPILFPGFSPNSYGKGVCNNGHSIVEGSYNSLYGVWDGPDPSDLLFTGSFDGGHMNSNGDAVFIDGHDDTLVWAVDLTTATPEPDSFVLLGTGCLSILGIVRRLKRT